MWMTMEVYDRFLYFFSPVLTVAIIDLEDSFSDMSRFHSELMNGKTFIHWL